jgi:hypothetical protein
MAGGHRSRLPVPLHGKMPGCLGCRDICDNTTACGMLMHPYLEGSDNVSEGTDGTDSKLPKCRQDEND